MSEIRQAQLELAKTQTELETAMVATMPETSRPTPADSQEAAEQAEKAAKAGGKGGVETLFRGAYRVQMDLTSLADNKANMMISINGIIMSIMIASVAPKLDANPWLLIPTAILLVGSLVSMIYAILAARPRVRTDYVSLSDLKHSKGNILFFGNFANMPQDEFVRGMEETMEDKVLVYETMIRNIHGIGSVLNKKFALLQVAYTAFMVALIAGVVSFLVVFIWVLQVQP